MKQNKNKILITGGTGFIGSAIVNLLVKMNKQIIVYDNDFRGRINRIAKYKKKNQLIF